MTWKCHQWWHQDMNDEWSSTIPDQNAASWYQGCWIMTTLLEQSPMRVRSVFVLLAWQLHKSTSTSKCSMVNRLVKKNLSMELQHGAWWQRHHFIPWASKVKSIEVSSAGVSTWLSVVAIAFRKLFSWDSKPSVAAAMRDYAARYPMGPWVELKSQVEATLQHGSSCYITTEWGRPFWIIGRETERAIKSNVEYIYHLST